MMGPSTSTEVDMFTYEGVNIYSYTLTKIPLQQPKIDKKKPQCLAGAELV